MPGPTSVPSFVEAPWLVACLCADWCGTCRDYRALFDAAAAAHAAEARFAWVDIEDDAELCGDVDVETFPTLLIARGAAPLFFGPLTPQPAVLERTLQTAFEGGFDLVGDDAAAALLQRLRER